jgi:flagellar biosynthesis/type III secretory pathway M-ring protein FliF/YscJ
MVVDTVMGIKVGGKTLKATIAGAFSTGGMEFPESIQNLVFALVEIIIGMVAYFVILIVLRLVSWIILFPLLKIFVKREENKNE